MQASFVTKQNQIYENHFRAVMPTLSRVEQTKYVREPDVGYLAIGYFKTISLADYPFPNEKDWRVAIGY